MKESKKRFRIPAVVFWIMKNTVAGAAAFLLIFFVVFKVQPGYKWVYNTMNNNYRAIKRNPNVTDQEKMRAKLGISYSYLEYIAEVTPKDAVILYPDKTALFPKDKKTEFRHDMYNKLWALRFLYPRKVVMTNEFNQSSYADKITHIAIVNGVGYELLDYNPPQRPTHAVFPLMRSYMNGLISTSVKDSQNK